MIMHWRFVITLVNPRVSKAKCFTCHILSLQTMVDITITVYDMVYIAKSGFDVMVCIIIT